jgi:hypothetical protein
MALPICCSSHASPSRALSPPGTTIRSVYKGYTPTAFCVCAANRQGPLPMCPVKRLLEPGYWVLAGQCRNYPSRSTMNRIGPTEGGVPHGRAPEVALLSCASARVHRTASPCLLLHWLPAGSLAVSDQLSASRWYFSTHSLRTRAPNAPGTPIRKTTPPYCAGGNVTA